MGAKDPLKVTTKTIRGERNPKGGCYAVLVGEVQLTAESSSKRAKGTAAKLREILGKARQDGYSSGFDSAADRYDPYGGRTP